MGLRFFVCMLSFCLYANAQDFKLSEDYYFTFNGVADFDLLEEVKQFDSQNIIQIWSKYNQGNDIDAIILEDVTELDHIQLYQSENSDGSIALKLTIEYMGCCSTLYDYYFFKKSGSWKQLEALENIQCDGPEPRLEYVFPYQERGIEGKILKVYVQYDQDGKLIESWIEQEIEWN